MAAVSLLLKYCHADQLTEIDVHEKQVGGARSGKEQLTNWDPAECSDGKVHG